MLVSTKSLDINIDFWGFDINLKVFLGTKLALLIHTDALTHAHTSKEHAWCLPGASTHAAMQVQPCSAPFELNIGLNQYRSMH